MEMNNTFWMLSKGMHQTVQIVFENWYFPASNGDNPPSDSPFFSLMAKHL